jgi:hypothetical protein
MSASLEAFAEFFGIDSDLVQAAAERSTVAMASTMSAEAVEGIISAMTDAAKTTMLSRLFDGDPHVAAELRAKVRNGMTSDVDAPPIVARTVGELRARAAAIGLAREQAAAEKLAAEHKRRVKDAEKARQARLLAIARRGEGVWREVEAEIERRNAAAYDKAAGASPRSPSARQATRHDRGLPSPTSRDPREACPQGTVHRTAGRNGIVYRALGKLAGHERR